MTSTRYDNTPTADFTILEEEEEYERRDSKDCWEMSPFGFWRRNDNVAIGERERVAKVSKKKKKQLKNVVKQPTNYNEKEKGVANIYLRS